MPESENFQNSYSKKLIPSKTADMSLKLSLNFEKQSINQGVLDTLSNGLQEDLERDVTLISLKECLAKLANGYKLPYKAANYLLTSVLCALAPEDGDTSEEMVSLDSPGTQIEAATQGGSSDATLDPPPEFPESIQSQASISQMEHFQLLRSRRVYPGARTEGT